LLDSGFKNTKAPDLEFWDEAVPRSITVTGISTMLLSTRMAARDESKSPCSKLAALIVA
jgi:hypothetical protein